MIDAHVHLEKGQDVGKFIYEMNKRQTQNF